jgi:hypothetical protein
MKSPYHRDGDYDYSLKIEKIEKGMCFCHITFIAKVEIITVPKNSNSSGTWTWQNVAPTFKYFQQDK